MTDGPPVQFPQLRSALNSKIERSLDLALDLAIQVVGAERCSLTTLVRETGELLLRKARMHQKQGSIHGSPNRGDAGDSSTARDKYALDIGGALITDSLETVSQLSERVLRLPISEGESLGVLKVANKRDGTSFDDLDLLVLRRIASLLNELLGLEHNLDSFQNVLDAVPDADQPDSSANSFQSRSSQPTKRANLARARELGIPYLVDPAQALTAEVARLVPLRVAHRYQCVPVGYNRGNLTLAMLDPTDRELLEALAGITRLKIHPVISSRPEIASALRRMSELRGKVAVADILLRRLGGARLELTTFVEPLTAKPDLTRVMRDIADALSTFGAQAKTAESHLLVVTTDCMASEKLIRAVERVDDLVIGCVLEA